MEYFRFSRIFKNLVLWVCDVGGVFSKFLIGDFRKLVVYMDLSWEEKFKLKINLGVIWCGWNKMSSDEIIKLENRRVLRIKFWGILLLRD